MRVKVGDGRECSLFYDMWIGNNRLCDRIDITPGANYRYVKEWVVGDRWIIPASFSRRYPGIAQEIRSVQLNSGADYFYWSCSKSGDYTIESTYDSIRIRLPVVQWRNVVWSSVIIPKQQFTLWLPFKGRLKTREILIQRGMQINDECGLGGNQSESIEHIFFECPVSKTS